MADHMTDAKIQEKLDTIAKNSTRNDKVSWERKMDNMVKLIASIRPIEDQIIDLIAQKQPLMDQVSALRDVMVKECIHPREQLVFHTSTDLGDYIECKFCSRRFAVMLDK